MGRFKAVLFVAVAGALLVLTDPSLAGNKFTTISGGVSGVGLKKIALLKNISGYAGGLILLLALIELLTRRKKKMKTSVLAPIILGGIGLILIVIYLI